MFNGVVLVDKPAGWTSHDVVAKLRGIMRQKKIGHTGTLDPDACGVLPVCLGHATKVCELLTDKRKTYEAVLLLGRETDTQDVSGQTLQEKEVNVTREEVEKALCNFRGEIYQLPPMYSAIKKDGVRLYELARQGIEIEREKRLVNISSLLLTNAEDKEYEIEVHCSKGTYIRSLISDIGEALGTGAVMTSLRRIYANGVSIDKCYTLSALEELNEKDELGKAVISVDDFISYPPIRVSAPQAKRFSNGGELDCNRFGGKKAPGLYRVYSQDDEFLGIGEIDKAVTQMSVKRVYVK